MKQTTENEEIKKEVTEATENVVENTESEMVSEEVSKDDENDDTSKDEWVEFNYGIRRNPKDIKIRIFTLAEIIERHQHWINRDCKNWMNMRAILSNLDLSNVNLRNVNLKDAYIVKTNFRGSDLSGANLTDAILISCDFSNTVMSSVNLTHSVLTNARLINADLARANLTNAALDGANLTDAFLFMTIMDGVSAIEIDFTGVRMRYLRAFDANLSCAINLPDFPINCPSDGAFIGWKAYVLSGDETAPCKSVVLIKLEIPEDAKRLSSISRKCRCDKAKVLGFYDLEGNEITELEEVVNNNYGTNTVYRKGEYVYPDSFDEDRWNECSNGIHFFIDKLDAMRY